MYTRSDNIEIMFGDDNDDIIEQIFESLLQKYEENSSIKWSVLVHLKSQPRRQNVQAQI